MKTNYTCLKRMLDNANWAHDLYWEIGLYDEALKYAKISQRILLAITNPLNKVICNS